MQLSTITLQMKIIQEIIKDKYNEVQQLDPKDQYWNIRLINDGNDMFILDCHNYNTTIYAQSEIKNPIQASWFVILDSIGRAKHTVANEIINGEKYLRLVDLSTLLRIANVKQDKLNIFYEFLNKKRFGQKNLATIKSTIERNKSTLAYFALANNSGPSFESLLDKESTLFFKATNLFGNWLIELGIFNYMYENDRLVVKSLRDVSLFKELFDFDIKVIVDSLAQNNQYAMIDNLVNLVGIPEDIVMPPTITDSFPNLLIVRETV